jgi:hypothetical protein
MPLISLGINVGRKAPITEPNEPKNNVVSILVLHTLPILLVTEKWKPTWHVDPHCIIYHSFQSTPIVVIQNHASRLLLSLFRFLVGNPTLQRRLYV